MSVQDSISYKIFFFGDTRVGKTSFILRMSDGTFEENLIASMGCDSKKKKTILENGQIAWIEMWDTAGQERFKSITRNLIRKADGVILLYSITDRPSFENVTQWLNDIKLMGQSNIPIVLVANKSDLNDERKVSVEEGKSLAESISIPFYEASCKEDINISDIFKTTVKAIYNKKQIRNNDTSGRISIDSKAFLPKKKKCC